MAFQINPNIPLQAMVNPINIGDAFTKAQSYQANALNLQALREQFNEEKEARLRQKQMQQGIASELQKMQQGTPAQYRTDFFQTMPTGQMPQGMTGVLAAERGQNMPTPDLFGENILKGNFDVRREMIAPEVKGVTPDYLDVLQIAAKHALQQNDIDSYVKFANGIKQERAAKAELDQPVGNPYPVYDTQGQAVGMRVMTKGGKEIAFGADGLTNVKPDVMTAYQKEQIKIERDKIAQAAELARLEREAKLNKPDPVTQALAIAQGKEDIKTASEQRAKVAEKYADASTAIDLLDDYITTAEKAPKTGAGEYIERGLGFFGGGNKEQQAAMGAMAQKAAALVTLAQKQTGPQSDKDVQNYKEQMGVIANAPNLEMKIAAAKAAKGFAQRVQQKYGSYASDILSGKVTPDELKQPSKPTRSKEELFKLYKEFKADYEAEKDPAMRKIMIDAARADGLIK